MTSPRKQTVHINGDNFVQSYYRAVNGPFSSLENEIPDHRKSIIRCFQEGVVDLLILSLGSVLEELESPIEEMLAGALILLSLEDYEVRVYPPHDAFILGNSPDILTIWPQKQIGEYRVDFYIENLCEPTGKISKIIVECDGHDFHEKTKEQAQKDKRRDRVLQSCGYPVFRFTGSEIWADPFKCAKFILEHLQKGITE